VDTARKIYVEKRIERITDKTKFTVNFTIGRKLENGEGIYTARVRKSRFSYSGCINSFSIF
jgi:hypothetical protein